MIKSSDSTQLLSVQSVAIVLKQITLFSAHRGIIFIHQTLLSLIVICHTLISRCMINYFVLKRFNSRYNTMRQKIIKLSLKIRGTGLKHILSSEKILRGFEMIQFFSVSSSYPSWEVNWLIVSTFSRRNKLQKEILNSFVMV